MPQKKRTTEGRRGMPKLFRCTGFGDCHMVFTRSEHLARHARKHTGEKPYKCIVPGCDRLFSRFDNMMQHTHTHNRSKKKSMSPTRSPTKSKTNESCPSSSSSSSSKSSMSPPYPVSSHQQNFPPSSMITDLASHGPSFHPDPARSVMTPSSYGMPYAQYPPMSLPASPLPEDEYHAMPRSGPYMMHEAMQFHPASSWAPAPVYYPITPPPPAGVVRHPPSYFPPGTSPRYPMPNYQYGMNFHDEYNDAHYSKISRPFVPASEPATSYSPPMTPSKMRRLSVVDLATPIQELDSAARHCPDFEKREHGHEIRSPLLSKTDHDDDKPAKDSKRRSIEGIAVTDDEYEALQAFSLFNKKPIIRSSVSPERDMFNLPSHTVSKQAV
ncbi:uncharacterized protein BYT42DRAFT_561148 [Radiomyces spectabilis]|uniref:uncharacterized protein n=1 Tax=Radiomyces spectabilis TaxID=64574 RepID=UPI0022208DA0|nr:uncharacterized protein BYT42DRAFT_561148 [Radiomyces spectabilis]KAI8388765.1 hypothetical protein BYT42DRAFT_561148 [Radiomyces spectabilis]